eukprot:854365-Prymnesium_polylepis.1
MRATVTPAIERSLEAAAGRSPSPVHSMLQQALLELLLRKHCGGRWVGPPGPWARSSACVGGAKTLNTADPTFFTIPFRTA